MPLQVVVKVAQIVKTILSTAGAWVKSGHPLLMLMGLVLFGAFLYAGHLLLM